jgi:hypothetical protein
MTPYLTAPARILRAVSLILAVLALVIGPTGPRTGAAQRITAGIRAVPRPTSAPPHA